MSGSELEEKNPRWADIWSASDRPRFDAGEVCPILAELERDGIIPSGRALVPGCGTGYDVTFLARENRVVRGIDIVQKAIDLATARRDSLPEEVFKANALFSTDSFFELPTDEENKFDFIYDYTFFCAIDPSLRPSWAEKMSNLIRSGGLLCTVIFPICEKEGGPPYAVSFDAYRDVLESRGFSVERLEMLREDQAHPGRSGQTTPEGITWFSGIGLWRKN